jgi:hypothetical protein
VDSVLDVLARAGVSVPMPRTWRLPLDAPLPSDLEGADVAALREVQQRMRPLTFYAERAAPQLNLVHKPKLAEPRASSTTRGTPSRTR